MLLKIFSELDENTLEVAGQVCNRWHYLSNTTELWLFKCIILGIREGLGRIEKILKEEQLSDEDIDWRLAYLELKQFITKLKEEYFEKIDKYYIGND